MKRSIDEVCRAAKECGMSYGMYVVASERMTEDAARRAMDEGKRLNPILWQKYTAGQAMCAVR